MFGFQDPGLRQHAKPDAAILFNQDDISGKRHAVVGAQHDVSFEQTLLSPRPVNGDAFVVCFRNAQRSYNYVFVVGVNLQTPFFVRGYVFIFFQTICPALKLCRSRSRSNGRVIIESVARLDVNLLSCRLRG